MLTLTTVLFSLAQGGEVDTDQFLRLVQANFDQIADVSFVFEGEVRRLDHHEPGNSNTRAQHNNTFQGAYSYRSDGATMLETYHMPDDGSPSHYSLSTMLNWELSRTDRIPDQELLPMYVEKGRGGPNALSISPSPESYFSVPFFRGLNEKGNFNFRHLGWEDVDGQPCLKVEVGGSPDSPNPRRGSKQYWIDMQRGGQPLKIEQYNGGTLTKIVNISKLVQITSDDNLQIWFPVRASIEVRDINGRPRFEEINSLVAGSVRINQGLTDDHFRIESRTGSTAGIDQIGKHQQVPPANQDDPRLRTDAESVEERLKAQLEAAEAQAEQLDASRTARIERGQGSILPRATLFVVGIGLIASVIIWRRMVR